MTSIPSLIGSFTEHDSPRAMTEVITRLVVDDLDTAISSRGAATLAVSGGSTPKALYQALANAPLDWSRITIVLVDDRWVAPGQAGSNEGFLHDTLLQGAAAKARFIGLKTSASTAIGGVPEACARLEGVARPFDVVLLGLGADGHTASWFPHARGLQEALAPFGPPVAAIEAHPSTVTGPFTERITLTYGALRGARRTILMIRGDDKRRAWEAAQGPGHVPAMPVRALIRDPDTPIETHWCA